ncbi:MAG: hypothetical protein Q8876_00150 [Bacillota bacterium]|nr:hypothetical protein [Bacillota bacterium]
MEIKIDQTSQNNFEKSHFNLLSDMSISAESFSEAFERDLRRYSSPLTEEQEASAR